MENGINTITVHWFLNGHETTGQEVLEGGRLGKRVFIERAFSGQAPAHNTTTQARVTYDSERTPDGKGKFYRVMPIHPLDPDALSEAEARARMLKVIREGHYLGETWLNVDMPGWQGELHGSFPRSIYGITSYGMVWRFTHRLRGSSLMIHDEGLVTVSITTGIERGRSGAVIVDWAQARADLGKPAKIDPQPGKAVMVAWTRNQRTLYAELSLRTALAAGCAFRNIRLNDCGHVIADVLLLDGRWILEAEVLATCEWFSPDHAFVHRARFHGEFENHLSPEQRRFVVTLLRPTLHSSAWHKQEYIRRVLSPEASHHGAIMVCVRALEKLVNDGLFPQDVMERTRRELQQARQALSSLSDRDPQFEADGASEIYIGQAIDDVTATVRLTEGNRANIENLNQTIALLNDNISRLLTARRSEPLDVLVQALEAAEALQKKLDKIEASVQPRDDAEEHDSRNMEAACSRIRFNCRPPLEKVLRLIDQSASIVVVLDALHEARLQFQWLQSWMKEWAPSPTTA